MGNVEGDMGPTFAQRLGKAFTGIDELKKAVNNLPFRSPIDSNASPSPETEQWKPVPTTTPETTTSNPNCPWANHTKYPSRWYGVRVDPWTI